MCTKMESKIGNWFLRLGYTDIGLVYILCSLMVAASVHLPEQLVKTDK